MNIGEDLKFNLDYLNKCEGYIGMINKTLYHYIKRTDDSLSLTYHESDIEDTKNIYRRFLEWEEQQQGVTEDNLLVIKSIYILKNIFLFLKPNISCNLVKYNNQLKEKLEYFTDDYLKASNYLIRKVENKGTGIGVESHYKDQNIVFLGNYINYKKNGLGNELQFKQLRELPCRKIILATDMDESGLTARKRIRMNMQNRKIVTEYIFPKGRKDANECTKEELINLQEVF